MEKDPKKIAARVEKVVGHLTDAILTVPQPQVTPRTASSITRPWNLHFGPLLLVYVEQAQWDALDPKPAFHYLLHARGDTSKHFGNSGWQTIDPSGFDYETSTNKVKPVLDATGLGSARNRPVKLRWAAANAGGKDFRPGEIHAMVKEFQAITK